MVASFMNNGTTISGSGVGGGGGYGTGIGGVSQPPSGGGFGTGIGVGGAGYGTGIGKNTAGDRTSGDGLRTVSFDGGFIRSVEQEFY